MDSTRGRDRRRILLPTVVLAALALAGALLAGLVRPGVPAASAAPTDAARPAPTNVTGAAPTDTTSAAPTGGRDAAPKERKDPANPTDPTAGLTPATRSAFVAAQEQAREEGLSLLLTSGFRTAEEQQELYDEAVRRYGSADEARWWVLPPDESMHVRGTAVDVRPREAARWLETDGARFGLCRTYDWEWWHFEYREQWRLAGRCPAPARR